MGPAQRPGPVKTRISLEILHSLIQVTSYLLLGLNILTQSLNKGIDIFFLISPQKIYIVCTDENVYQQLYVQRTKRTLIYFADNVGPDQDRHCPLIESIDTDVYVDEQRMSRSDCTDEPADLDLRCSHMA